MRDGGAARSAALLTGFLLVAWLQVIGALAVLLWSWVRKAAAFIGRWLRKLLRVCERTELFTLAESLGGVESLIEHPGRMTHASAAGSPLEVPADLVRLSVGIEDVEDLLADLEHALG